MSWKYQRGEVWWIGYRVNGKQVLRSTNSTDEQQANRELARIRSMDQAHKAGSLTEEFYRALTRKESSTETLKGQIKVWLSDCSDLSPVTLKKYQDVTDEFCEYLNATDAAPLLSEIRRESVGAFLRKKRSDTSTITAKLARRILVVFFNHAVANEKLQTLPVASCKSLGLTKESDSVRRAFTLAELKTMFDKAPSDFWRYMIVAGLYTGQRMGDLVTLLWTNVDLDANVLRIVQRKTGKTVTVPLRGELRTMLLNLKRKAGKVKPTDPLWPEQCSRYEKTGAGTLSNEFYDDVLLPAGLVRKRTHHAKKSKPGQEPTGSRKVSAVSFHCLRHTFVSMLKLSGANQATTKELAGHSSDAISDLYTHVPEESLTKAIKQLPEAFK